MEILVDIIFILGSILIGLWLADFASGCFHWVVDGYCDPTWPLIGPAYIAPAHLHHDEGKYEFEMASIVTHLYIWSAVLVVGTIFWALGFMSLTIASACFFGALTNIIHRWSHTRPEDNTAHRQRAAARGPLSILTSSHLPPSGRRRPLLPADGPR